LPGRRHRDRDARAARLLPDYDRRADPSGLCRNSPRRYAGYWVRTTAHRTWCWARRFWVRARRS